MAELDVVFLSSQLKRLNKDDLINLIISKDVSQITGASEQLKQQLFLVLGVQKDNQEQREDHDDVSEVSGGQYGALEGKYRQLHREYNLMAKLNEQMEGRIAEQVMLIDLLKSGTKTDISAKNKSKNSIFTKSMEATSVVDASVASTTSGSVSAPIGSFASKKPVIENKEGVKEAARRTNFVRGTGEVPAISVGSECNTFAAVARRAYFYIGNVNINTKTDHICNYLRKKCPDQLFVLDELPKREQAQSKAYKLTTDFTLMDTINNPQFWPQGIIIKKFFRRNNNQIAC